MFPLCGPTVLDQTDLIDLGSAVRILAQTVEPATRLEILEPVTSQVTTAPGNARPSAMHPDSDIPLNCGNPT